ncbi:MAG: hypothetical protein R3Y28_07345 [Candidatus Gastranaerophilales bacterium]
MKINNIIPNYQNKTQFNKNQNQQPKTYTNNPLQADTFVKSKNVNFTASLKPFTECIEDISNKLLEKLYSNQKTTLKDFETIIQRYSPTTRVEEFATADKTNSNITEITRAYMKQPMGFDMQSKRLVTYPKTILIDDPNKGHVTERADLFACFVHESTHVLQEEHPLKTSRFEILDKYVQNTDNMSEITQNLQLAPKIFTQIESILNQHYAYTFMKTDRYPRAIMTSPIQALENDTQKKMNMSYPEFVRMIVTQTISQIENQFGPVDKNFIKKYIAATAKGEKEAYKNEVGFLKSAFHIKQTTDLDVRETVYEELIKFVES